MNDAARAAEQAARASYGRLLAILASRTADIAAAEDALADAFAKALSCWPQDGIPNRPEAWLLTTARNRLTDHQRRAARLAPEDDMPEIATQPIADFPDERLKLMFVCAHPAIDRALHTPLMLQTVLGIEAAEIARCFVVSPTAMAQRLVRAKAKIKASGIAFRVPDAPDLPSRLAAVLEAVYGAYALDWLQGGETLSDEALYLAVLLSRLMPENPEPLGLAALIAFGQSRKTARIVDGMLVPVSEQDTALWDHDIINHAAHMLTRAEAMKGIGRFQIEAAIQAVHAHRATTGITDWAALAQLNEALVRLYPTLGALVARAVAIGRATTPEAGLALLEGFDSEKISDFQPFHAALAHFLAQTGQATKARSSYETAIKLCTEPEMRMWLLRQSAQL